MEIREITPQEFEYFTINHKYGNFHQTQNYALVKSEEDYEYEYIGYFYDNEIKAAALVLVKQIKFLLYAYVPEGFVIDYSDQSLVENFTNDLKKYYEKEKIVFIKINPRVIAGTIDPKTLKTTYNDDYFISSRLQYLGYKYLGENMGFEAVLPRFNAVVDLKNYSFNKLTKNAKNKIRKAYHKGLFCEKVNEEKAHIVFDLIKKNNNKKKYHYDDYYNVFSKTDSIDLFLVSLNYDSYVRSAQENYDYELLNNQRINALVQLYPTERNINKKLNSDSKLESYRNDVSNATKMINSKPLYLAAAIVIKYANKVTILISSFDKNYKEYAANYYLYYNILEYYQDDFDYLDLNGITGNLLNDKEYAGLNRFKMGFNPNLYEYIGEYDLILNKVKYDYLLRSGLLAKEFNKK